jgi:glycosyltransferase involved in cell wall biosynthesis
MKILILSIAHFCDLHGGIPRIVQDESAELLRRGDEVWVLAPGAPSRCEHEIRDGVHLLRYVPDKVVPWNPTRSTAHQRAATAVLTRYLPQVDAIHGHAPLPYLAALDLYGASVHSSYTIHSPARMEMAIAWRNSSLLHRITGPLGLAIISKMERDCILRSRVVTALSRYTIACIAAIHGKETADHIRLMPGWVETSRYVPMDDRERAKRQLGWPSGIPILFTLRRLSSRMGLDRLLEASASLRGEGVAFHLMIGGTGPLQQSLENQSRALGLGETVTFLGQIDDDKLPLAYAACDAFVLPTAELECFGLIALEALSAGRPVLATPVGAIPEIVGKFEPDWISQSPQAESIAELLRQYLSGKQNRHNATELHEQATREYGREQLLPRFVEATVRSGAQI